VLFRVGLVLISTLVLQLALFSELRINGVAAQLLLAASVSAGLTGGPDRGSAFGFAAGLLIDLYLPTPFGLSAAAYALAAGVIGLARDSVIERSPLTLLGFPAMGTAIGLVAFVLGAVALGFSEVHTGSTGRILITVVLMNAIAGVVLVPVTRWMWHANWGNGSTIRRSLT